ncbi:MAG: DUF99 family protein [Candidatus Aenigmarchaeota archaeon]|nr:DUF99 family protein [Candidatus Aenigmarchaeota archaeon]
MLDIRSLKREIRIVGWDDAPFDKHDKTVRIFGAIFRGGSWMDGLLSTKIRIDGDDATKKIASVLNETRHKKQLRIIMLDGITLGGFNVVDLEKLHKETDMGVIAVSRKMPEFLKIKRALIKVRDGGKKWALIEKAGAPVKMEISGRSIYYQSCGINRKDAADVIRLSSTRALIPEPLRIAHIIASGVVKGESRGRA